MLGSTDLEQLVWATAHGRVLDSFQHPRVLSRAEQLSCAGKPYAGIILAQLSGSEELRKGLQQNL